MEMDYTACRLCPRNCGTDRRRSTGVCGMTDQLCVSRAALHFWEEPCISGTRGSGTVFFAGCSLRCVFCQNREISQGSASGIPAGRESTFQTISAERLVELFYRLEEQGANNINLVTADHFLPTIARAVEKAKQQGFSLPFLLNTGGYLNVDTVKGLEGLIDIYLPDFKYIRDADALRYSRAAGYPDAAKAAIAEMVRQQPECRFAPESTENEDVRILQRGVVVRHLLLPGVLIQAKQIVSYLHKTYGEKIWISLLRQYTPEHAILSKDYPEIDRKVTGREYKSLVDFAAGIGVTQGFVQEEESADSAFIPAFDGTGL